MKRPGDILKRRREELGLSLPELESSCNIPRRSLEALEQDDDSFFAAEFYYCGFLKNYAESLNLDPKMLLHAYQNVKIIESPLPIQELTGNNDKPKFSPMLLSGIVVLCLLAALVGAYFVFYPKWQKRGAQLVTTESGAAAQTAAARSESHATEINRYPWMQDLAHGQVLRLVLNAEQEDLLQPELRVNRVGREFQLVSLNLAEKNELALFTGKTNSLTLKLTNTNEEVFSFRLDFTLQEGGDAVLINLEESKRDDSLSKLEGERDIRFAAFQKQDWSSVVPHAILQARRPIPLRLQLRFLRDSYIRYQWFGQDAKEFPILKTKVLDLQGEAPLTLWLSDVKATKIKINGQDLVPEAFQNVFIGRLEWKREVSVARLYLTPSP